jgi:hypothetical protein
MINNSSSAVAFPAFVRMPPADMMGPSTTLTGQFYGDGTYEATQSSFFQSEGYTGAYNAFRPINNGMWHTNGDYDSTTGMHTGTGSTTIGSISYRGEWAQIRLPSPISLDSYSITPRQDLANFRSPRNFIILGSTNGIAWTVIQNLTNINDWTTATKTFKPPFSPAFSYFRMHVSRVGNSDNHPWQDSVNIIYWGLFAAVTTDDSYFVEAEPGSTVRLQSVKFPDHYLRVNDGFLQVRREASGDTTFRNVSLFQIASGFGGLSVPIISN